MGTCSMLREHVLVHEVRPTSLSLITRLWHAELPESIIAPRICNT
jgi:hypothetical protein